MTGNWRPDLSRSAARVHRAANSQLECQQLEVRGGAAGAGFRPLPPFPAIQGPAAPNVHPPARLPREQYSVTTQGGAGHTPCKKVGKTQIGRCALGQGMCGVRKGRGGTGGSGCTRQGRAQQGLRSLGRRPRTRNPMMLGCRSAAISPASAHTGRRQGKHQLLLRVPRNAYHARAATYIHTCRHSANSCRPTAGLAVGG